MLNIPALGECSLHVSPRLNSNNRVTPFIVKAKGSGYRRVYEDEIFGQYVIVGGEPHPLGCYLIAAG